MPTRSERTTNALLDAVVTILGDQGWDSLTHAQAARVMGSSIRPVVNRAPDKPSLLIRTWEERISEMLIESIRSVISGVSRDNHQDFLDSTLKLLENSSEHRAWVETLIVTAYEPDLFEAVDRSLGNFIRQTVTPSHEVSYEQASRNSYLIQLSLGLLLSSNYPRMHSGMEPALELVWQSLQTGGGLGEDLSTPKGFNADHIDVFPEMAPGDANLERVLRETLTIISERGYKGARIVDIAAAAGVTEGFIFGRYATKKDLLLDTLQRQQQAGFALNAEYLDSLESQLSPGMAAAVLMREVLKPGRDLGRNMALELLRLSWHDNDFLIAASGEMDEGERTTSVASNYSLDSAVDFGTYLLPRFAPDAWELPMAVVFEPLHEVRATSSGEMTGE